MKIIIFLILISSCIYSQNDGVKTPVYTDYKNDSSFINFGKLKNDVAKAQITSLKKGALLVRLKTNNQTISKLKQAGNNDLATQLEREQAIKNKIIIYSYLLEFKFCPVYFFYSDYSDSVKHKSLNGIFVDTTLSINSTIVCNESFYMIADNRSIIYNSSLGLVPENKTRLVSENGTASRDVAIAVKNSQFIQVHKPFPYFQIKSTSLSSANETTNNLKNTLFNLYVQLQKEKISMSEFKDYKKFKGSVYLFDEALEAFYKENESYIIPSHIKEYIY